MYIITLLICVLIQPNQVANKLCLLLLLTSRTEHPVPFPLPVHSPGASLPSPIVLPGRWEGIELTSNGQISPLDGRISVTGTAIDARRCHAAIQ